MKTQLSPLILTCALFACSESTNLPAIEAPTNGYLAGYTVMQGDRIICKDPQVSVQFRGPTSYIVCPSEPSDSNFPGLQVSLPEKGVLTGYLVQDQFGKSICSDPTVGGHAQTSANIIMCP